jgi:hypothetical protein
MKHLVLILSTLLSFPKLGVANKIDSIKTDKDVTKFIAVLFRETTGMDYYRFSIKKPDSVFNWIPCDTTILNWGTKSWQKIDFNKDGLTDLFAVVYKLDTINSKAAHYTIYTIIDKGNNRFALEEIPGYFLINCYAAKPIFINGNPFILYRHYKTEMIVDSLSPNVSPTNENFHYYEVGKTDTLIYKYGGFIELNTVKYQLPIKSLFFETTSCLGSCPAFKLNIFKDGSAYYEVDLTLEEKEGNFRSTIKPKELNEIFSLINYLNLPSLDEYYSASGTDQPSCRLSVFFSDGSVKTIGDYGQQGTLGLVRLYKLLFSLRHNQNWK